MIRHVIDSHTQPIPAVLEIPSKDHPYDASKDSILRRAKVYFRLIDNRSFNLTCDYFFVLKNIIHYINCLQGMFNPEDIH